MLNKKINIVDPVGQSVEEEKGPRDGWLTSKSPVVAWNWVLWSQNIALYVNLIATPWFVWIIISRFYILTREIEKNSQIFRTLYDSSVVFALKFRILHCIFTFSSFFYIIIILNYDIEYVIIYDYNEYVFCSTRNEIQNTCNNPHSYFHHSFCTQVTHL